MQRNSQHPVRPLPVAGGTSELEQLFKLARTGGLQQRSAFNTVGSAPSFLPEFSLYNAAQLSGLLNNNTSAQLEQLAQLQQLQNLQNTQATLLGSAQQPESSVSRNSQGKGNSRGDKSSSGYASRHQAAEQRRRSRINDRLERLRQVVPHSERANTATFLEEVIKYVEALEARITELETAQGLPLTCPQSQKHQQSSPISQVWLQQLQSAAAKAVGPNAVTGFPVAANQTLAAAQLLLSQSQVSAAPAIQTALPSLQKDRPETPPQKQTADSQEEDNAVTGSVEREASPSTASEGSVPKKAKLA